MIITDSILAREDVLKCKKIEQLSIASLIGEAIGRITENNNLFLIFSSRSWSPQQSQRRHYPYGEIVDEIIENGLEENI